MFQPKMTFWYFAVKSSLATLVGAYLKVLQNPYADWLLGIGVLFSAISFYMLFKIYKSTTQKNIN